MRKLIRLELKKVKFGGLLRGALLANVLIALWCIGNKGGNVQEGYPTYAVAFADIGNYVRMTFIVFSAVLLARMIIDEYRTRTISVLFTYPVPRKRLFAAKLIPILVFTFLIVAVSNGVLDGLLILWNRHDHDITEGLTSGILLTELGRLLVLSAAVAGSALVPLFFGMIKKSVPAAIVTSFVIGLAQMNVFNDVNVYDNVKLSALWAMPFAAIGMIMAYLAIRNVETADVN